MIITITNEDYLASAGEFDSPSCCPLNQAMKRHGIPAELVGFHVIYGDSDLTELGQISPPFYRRHFDELKEAVESGYEYTFTTEYTPA